MAELVGEGRGGPHDESSIGADLRERAAGWVSREQFADHVAALRASALRAAALENTPREPGRVACSTWWWIEGQTWLGRIALRHHLTPHLLEVGGHIGYDVRPSARRKGHATAMLRAVLPHVAALGITDALLTCDVDNGASGRVIEVNGGRLEDERAGKLRFWLRTERS